MLRSILIGLDSSASGLAAQELGVQWAQQLGCRLAGIAIVDNPGSPFNKGTMSSGVSYHGTESTLVGEPRAKAAAVLQAVEDAFGRRCGEAGVAFQLVEDIGSPHVRILLEAQKHDIVLLGQRSHFEFGWEAKPGETLEKVLQDSPRPVVVVPGTLRPGTSIAVCYDGSLQAARALASFVGTGLGRGCAVHVIAAATDRLQAALHAERSLEFLSNHELDATSHIVESTRHPAEPILKKAQQLDAGLLVMGAYGQSVLREFFLGSVTESILKESPIPVFCYH